MHFHLYVCVFFKMGSILNFLFSIFSILTKLKEKKKKGLHPLIRHSQSFQPFILLIDCSKVNLSTMGKINK